LPHRHASRHALISGTATGVGARRPYNRGWRDTRFAAISRADKASGTQLIHELIADGCYGVTRYQPTTEKIMRLNSQTGVIDNVHIPETAPWLAEYLHEMTVSPKDKHDDQVDSTAQFLDWYKRPFPSQGHFEYMRQRAQELQQRDKPQPTKTVWAIGSMEWLAEQKEAG
jgi:predicted phage terminase large subunit-like protein